MRECVSRFTCFSLFFCCCWGCLSAPKVVPRDHGHETWQACPVRYGLYHIIIYSTSGPRYLMHTRHTCTPGTIVPGAGIDFPYQENTNNGPMVVGMMVWRYCCAK